MSNLRSVGRRWRIGCAGRCDFRLATAVHGISQLSTRIRPQISNRFLPARERNGGRRNGWTQGRLSKVNGDWAICVADNRSASPRAAGPRYIRCVEIGPLILTHMPYLITRTPAQIHETIFPICRRVEFETMPTKLHAAAVDTYMGLRLLNVQCGLLYRICRVLMRQRSAMRRLCSCKYTVNKLTKILRCV